MPRPPLLPLLRVAAAIALGFLLLWGPRRRTALPVAGRQADVVWAVDVAALPVGALRVGEKATGPLPGQKRPPCVPRAEREVAGACWEPHLERPPCPPTYYEGDGMCLRPVLAAKRPATSIQP